MSRPLTLSNGSLHVGLNERASVSDFYYPHVGQENHVPGEALHHRLGVWVDGVVSWLDDSDWTVEITREAQANIGTTIASNQQIGVRLEFTDAVYSGDAIFMRSIHIVNLRDSDHMIKLFTHQVFAIGDSRSNTDTAQYLPENQAILHYRGRRAFVVGGMFDDKSVFNEHSIGLYGIEGHEGTFKDAEDGELGDNNVEHGRVDSVLGFYANVGAHDSVRVHYWIAAGTSTTDALRLHMELRDKGTHPFFTETAAYWKKWLKPALNKLPAVAERHQRSLIDSLIILKSHFDDGGAIIASTDTTMLNYSRDAYAYCWPRDGAFACWPLIRLGYQAEPLAFFRFIARVIHPGGYVMHKYFADGSLGPSWHPYMHGDVASAPIQEDETATILFMLSEFVSATGNLDLLGEFYEPLVKPMADFLCDFVDKRTGLPKPSYDLWEEVFQTSTYTVATVYGALLAASQLAERRTQPEDALHWQSSAGALRKAAHKHLFNTERGYFYKGVRMDGDAIVYDPVIDSASLYGVLVFGLFEPDSQAVTTSIKTIIASLSDSQHFDGTARYENDQYNRNETSGVGNPWFITSLWQAQAALSEAASERADMIIDWVVSHTGSTGVLAEQADRATGTPLSVAPLAWSHAELINTLLDRGNDA
jgi:GH15 family glucan-1,4-alpha-glucosidase